MALTSERIYTDFTHFWHVLLRKYETLRSFFLLGSSSLFLIRRWEEDSLDFTEKVYEDLWRKLNFTI